MENTALKLVSSPVAAPTAEAAPAAQHNVLDLYVRSQVARATGGVSPIAMRLAFQDWWQHLAMAPGKRSELASYWLGMLAGAGRGGAPDEDTRFADDAWRSWPFAWYARGFKQLERFWAEATRDVPGVSPHHAEVVAFTARQLLDMWSPSNYLWSNPEVLRSALSTGGRRP